MPGPWLNFLVALALGLLIGVERERTKGEGPSRGAAGLRTFGIASLLGASGRGRRGASSPGRHDDQRLRQGGDGMGTGDRAFASGVLPGLALSLAAAWLAALPALGAHG